MIAHRQGNPSQRVFPQIRPDIYTNDDDLIGLTPDQRFARNLLALANKKFTRWERLVGWKLDGLGQIGRLLLQHRLAIEAELAAQWQRADFLWNQVQIEIKTLLTKDDVWQSLVSAIADQPGVEVMNHPIKLRQRLVHELLIDTHSAFYNGLTKQPENLSLKDRAFVHIDYIQELLELSALSGDDLLKVLALPWKKRIALYIEEQKWQQAIDLCSNRLKYFPDSIDYQNELAEVHFSATLAKLGKGKSEAQQLKDAKRLQDGINHLEKLSKDYPYNLRIFELLGHLHHLRAISLGNGSHLAEALTAVQKALVYNPYLKEVFETRNQLVETMNMLQAQMKEVEAKLATQFNASLNEKGQRLRAEASKGFAPMNAYMKSAKAKETMYGLKIAQAMSLWQRIGLPEPQESFNNSSPAVMHTQSGEELPTESTTHWGRQALVLLDGLNLIFNNPPQNQWDLAAAWEAVVAKKPELAELDSGLIYTFLDRKLFRSTEEPVTPETSIPLSELPQLTPVSVKPKQGAEPFLPWLFSHQDIRIKVQAAVASVLVLTAGGLTIQDKLIRSTRDTAYRQILEAEQQQDHLSVIKGAEKFFANSPISGKDQRDRQVMQLYSEALVRWVAQQEDPLDHKDQKHLDRYRAAISKSNQEGN
ncbi:MAG: hypothetical protein F6K55_09740 [Moorea sp. SIO4A3]|nr:hypothetical protein [Moorena sp. SIO4A3]